MIEMMLIFGYFLGAHFKLWLWIVALAMIPIRVYMFAFPRERSVGSGINILGPMLIVAGWGGDPSPVWWWMWVVAVAATMFIVSIEILRAKRDKGGKQK